VPAGTAPPVVPTDGDLAVGGVLGPSPAAYLVDYLVIGKE